MQLPQTPPIVVIGMHRSGTSLVAEILAELGVHIGRELDIHSESELFKEINRDLLALAGGHWARPRPFLEALGDAGFERRAEAHARERLAAELDRYGEVRGQAWAFKDPRTTLTLPVWRRVFPEMRLLHVVRHGIDVALSVHRREVRRWLRPSNERRLFPPTLGASYRLWTTYVEAGRRHAAAFSPCLDLRYEDLLERPREELPRIVAAGELDADSERLEHIAHNHLRRPSRRSLLEGARVRLLARLGRLDPRPLHELGYEIC